MNTFKLLALASAALIGSSASAVFDINMKITAAVQTCVGGEKIECKQVVNAIGQVVKMPLKDLKIQDLDLSKGQQDLSLPVVPGARTAYSFVPKEGELAGKTVVLAFDNVAQRPGTKDYGKMVVKMYRHAKGVDAQDEWTEVGDISIEKLSWPFTMKQDGTFMSQDKPFFLGQKQIS